MRALLSGDGPAGGAQYEARGAAAELQRVQRRCRPGARSTEHAVEASPGSRAGTGEPGGDRNKSTVPMTCARPAVPDPDGMATSSTIAQDSRLTMMLVRDEIVFRMADTDEAATDLEHAVVARYRLADDGLGELGQREVVRQAQSRMAEAIEQAGVGEFDGNEYGGGEVALYAYGPDADALFAVMAPILRALPFRPAHVILRYGSVDEPSAAERRVDL
ncbi:hypothetical protein [Streptomyces erythrochromogenes]|uniref:hypothetical protein n=1 Tax=Streptomyces erythrochromogenes TaxID=285574 RepID=UPI00386522CA|nr:hypothetical protein OG364_39225 [Streptomyces erythrochromogenes]